MNKKGFTLIELVATVAILCIIFLIITPKMTELINKSENKNKQAIEAKLILSAKEYVSNYNNNFITNFTNVGTIDYINAIILVEEGLIDEEEIIDSYSNINNLRIKVELKANDKLEYTIVYSGD